MMKGEKLISQLAFLRTEEGKILMEKTIKNLIATVEKTPSATKILAKHGWYIPFSSIPEEVFGYAEALEKGNVDLINNALEKLFENDFNNIISRACHNFPDRTNVLMEAKNAHENQMYFSSTILFLSTADGIFSGALFEKNKFAKTMNKKGIKKNPFTEFLTDEISITKYFDFKKNNTNSLNRHGVMHGHDVAYGTKLNSLKSISLLDYIAEFVLRNP